MESKENPVLGTFVSTPDFPADAAVHNHVADYASLERAFIDPALPALANQRYCLYTFIPCTGATPDKNGLYGLVKVRGVFSTESEAKSHADELVQKHDPYHSIMTGLVGRPYPLYADRKFGDRSNHERRKLKVEKDQIHTIVAEDLNKKVNDEAKAREDIKAREKLLLEDAARTEEEPSEYYTTLQTKRAQIVWTYLQTINKLEEMKGIVANTSAEIARMDAEHPEAREGYIKRWTEAQAKIGNAPESLNASFIKYLGGDLADFYNVDIKVERKEGEDAVPAASSSTILFPTARPAETPEERAESLFRLANEMRANKGLEPLTREEYDAGRARISAAAHRQEEE